MSNEMAHEITAAMAHEITTAMAHEITNHSGSKNVQQVGENSNRKPLSFH